MGCALDFRHVADMGICKPESRKDREKIWGVRTRRGDKIMPCLRTSGPTFAEAEVG